MKYSYIKNEAYDLHIGKSNKFKTNRITIKFLNYLTNKNATKRVLIPNVLKASTNKYPSKKDLSKKLEELFDIDLISSTNRDGTASLIEFSISYIDKKYIGKDLFNEAIDIINQIIFHPTLENKYFKKEIVNEEKRLLRDSLEGLLEDKNYLALFNFNKLMFKKENASINEFGNIKDLSKINEKNLYIEYQEMLNNDMIDIVLEGNFDDDISELIKDKFPFVKRNTLINPCDNTLKEVKKIKKKIEYDDIKEGKLILGYRIPLSNNSHDFYTQVLFQTILCDSPKSKLYLNVREKLSLCYSIESLLSTNLNYGIIYALIDWNNFDIALDAIKKSINEMKNGLFTDEEIKDAILIIKNNIYEIMDSCSFLSQQCYNKKIYNRSLDIEEIFKTYDSITKEDLLKFSNKITLDTIYMLREYENE